MKMMIGLTVTSVHGIISKGLVKVLEELEIRGFLETIHKYSIIKISQNTEMNPGDLKRLAVSQTPLDDNQLTLVWKIL